MALIDMAEENRRGLDLLDDYIEAHIHGPLMIADDVAAVVLDPCYQGTPIEQAAHSLPCSVEWHEGFRLPVERRDDCERYRGIAAAEAVSAIGSGGFITPLAIGEARAAGMDYQITKWVWHCVARFGRG